MAPSVASATTCRQMLSVVRARAKPEATCSPWLSSTRPTVIAPSTPQWTCSMRTRVDILGLRPAFLIASAVSPRLRIPVRSLCAFRHRPGGKSNRPPSIPKMGGLMVGEERFPIFGNPANCNPVWGQSRGFASPPCDGFALACLRLATLLPKQPGCRDLPSSFSKSSPSAGLGFSSTQRHHTTARSCS
jgi:hypothetical protein